MTRIFRTIPIIKRLYPTLKKQWAALTWVGGYKVKRYKGLLLLLNYRNLIDKHIGLHDGYEEGQFSYLLPQIQKGCDVFLDIGACSGLYSLRVAQLGIVKEIHAFEPDPRNCAQLQTGRYINGFLGAVSLHELALSDTTGTLQFELAAKNVLTKVATDDSPLETLKLIPCKPLDAILTYHGKKIFAKIDVEGHELSVLRGATQILKDNDCFLQVEAWEDNADAVVAALTTQGYKQIHRIQNDYYFIKA